MLEEELSSELHKKFTQESTNIQMSIQSQKREQTTLRIEIKNLRVSFIYRLLNYLQFRLTLLQQQYNTFLQNELRELNRMLNKGRQELEYLASKAMELKLNMIGGSKLLREAQEQQNRVILDLNLMKMQVNIAKDGYKKVEDQISNFERKRVVMESVSTYQAKVSPVGYTLPVENCQSTCHES